MEKQNSLYNSRNLYEIFRKYMKILILILKNSSFNLETQNAIAKRNSGIPGIFW